MQMRDLVRSIEAEFGRFKAAGERAIAQASDAELTAAIAPGGNSMAVLVWHVSGNFASRFTDFLTSDGEKPWRRRDEEFDQRGVTRAELLEKWQRGWDVLFGALAGLSDANLQDAITIRGVPFKVHEALHRALGHTGYHVGQIVFLAKTLRGDAWTTLSIPRGASDAYNQNPSLDRPEAHAAALKKTPAS
jgi:hypothetical protein